MSNIYLNEPKTISYTNTTPDVTATPDKMDYWAPSNSTDTATGTINTVVVTSAVFTAVIPANTLNAAGEWRVSFRDSVKALSWDAAAFTVKLHGAI